MQWDKEKKLAGTARKGETDVIARSGKVVVRDFFALDLALHTGLRVMEIAQLNHGGVFVGNGMPSLPVRNGKGGKERLVRFGESFKRRFDEYVYWKETSGGAGSDTVISPKMHRRFCLSYDLWIHRALHDVGHISTYHTCGGMMNLLDLIIENETDVSETLAPQGTGGNITEPEKVREVFSCKAAMIGGMDQCNILTEGSRQDIRKEVFRLFEGFGRGGGYIMAASDTSLLHRLRI